MALRSSAFYFLCLPRDTGGTSPCESSVGVSFVIEILNAERHVLDLVNCIVQLVSKRIFSISSNLVLCSCHWNLLIHRNQNYNAMDL